MFYRPWTDREIERLGHMWEARATAKECAAALGRTFGATRQALHRFQIRRRPRCEQWQELFAQPHTLREAARRMRVSYSAAREARRRLRLRGVKVWEG